MRVVIVIPARGGSKRIPKKNIKRFCGRPIIDYPLELSKKLDLNAKVIVSTDCSDIAQLVKSRVGVEVVMRPEELADDKTPTQPVVNHVIKRKGLNRDDIVCCIYPCTPLLQAAHVLEGIERVKQKGGCFVMPVVKYGHPIQRSFSKTDDGFLEMNNREYELTPTQLLEPNYHDAGQFYVAYAKTWLSEKKIHSAAYGIEIPNTELIDIDNQSDWELAEALYRANLGTKK